MSKAPFLITILLFSTSLMLLVFFYIQRLFKAVSVLEQRREELEDTEQEIAYLLDEASFQLALLGVLKAEFTGGGERHSFESKAYDQIDDLQ